MKNENKHLTDQEKQELARILRDNPDCENYIRHLLTIRSPAEVIDRIEGFIEAFEDRHPSAAWMTRRGE